MRPPGRRPLLAPAPIKCLCGHGLADWTGIGSDGLFLDLRQSSTIARAIVFILMGLLLDMNAPYARFRERFSPQSYDSTETEAPDAGQDLLPILW